MIGRILWWATLGAIGIVTAFLQFDMASRSNPALAEIVPSPLRNYAQVRIAQGAIEAEDAARALAEAERLVRRRPLPAEHLTLLAAAQAKAGDAEQAGVTIQIAARRGWREPVAQEAMLRLALAAGDRAEAARRYAALFLRQETPDALLREIGPAVLEGQDSSGRETIAAIVVGGERWHPMFLRRGPGVMPPAAFSAIAAMSLRDGAAFDCGQLAQSIATLERRDATASEQLRTAATGRCPQLTPKASSSR